MGMMVVVMGCNSGGVAGGEEGKNKFLQSLVNVSNEFLNVFTSFGEMVGSVLGLNLESKKSDVGNYFKTVHGTVEGVKTGLNKIVSEMKKEKNPNAEATATVVNKLVTETLDKIIAGAKEASEAIGTEGNDLIGNIASAGAAAAGVKGETEKLIKGIKNIVDIVLKNEGNAEAGDDKKAEDGSSSRGVTAGEAGKLFGNTGGGLIAANAEKAAVDGAKAVGAVTGADILKAMIKNGGDAVKLANTDPTKAAAGITSSKDATIAGAIALRAMVKDGKFANGNAGNDVAAAIKGVSVGVVIKVLDTLTVAIRKTVDAELKRVKESIKINADANPVSAADSSTELSK
ncbi:variable large family protein [Borrelia hispanica]|uniref:variable large family protein n=1 Tax=Borrelia hispanica TaxID=40835 RepID=UPI003899514C